MSILLRDVINIPERAGAEDYVLRLTDSVEADHLTRTLDDYVVTPSLTEAFDVALDLVSDAVRNHTSRGAFLMGSFGSGKSHFMAVLYALLRNNPRARAIAELQPTVAKHDPALQGKNILPLAFHFLAAESVEQALFAGYLHQIRRLHPGCVLPALHESDKVLADADNLRATMGEDAFFAGLNRNATASDDGWGAVLGEDDWDAARYDAARAAAPGSQPRQELITALADVYFTSFTRQSGFVDLDTGLSAMSEHAKTLGYDAVVLFLDEVVLWLAFHVRNTAVFARESQKLSKLVEGGVGSRALPLVSFIARQLDLTRWFADSGASGSQQEALDQAFRHQDGRFSKIRLGDDNLAWVANRRLLKPKDEDAGATLDEAFRRIDRRPEVWDVLLDGVNTDERHRGADEAAFRRTYPFSPALVSTLRSLSGAMQRERTALKVMQQMLVDRRDVLAVDDVIPVGDAFDYIVTGQSGQALDAEVAARFRAADKLYAEKLLPLLLQPYQLTVQDLEAGVQRPAGLVADERLAKTLLLSAVAPSVPALKGLTISRLASLNHGSIASPLPGGEVTTAGSKVRTWSKNVPEIKVDPDQRNPIVRVELADVDYESVVERARAEDNAGRRRELVKELVLEALAVETPSQLPMDGFIAKKIIWRGSSRDVDILFGKVRDASWLNDDQFLARAGTWRVVIDYPFDHDQHPLSAAVERLDRLIAANVRSRTLVWVPRFLAHERIADVSRLVLLNWLLDGAGERFDRYADHLSETDRGVARAILESQRSTLRDAIIRAIGVAYDAASPSASVDVSTDTTHERVFTSLDRSFSPQPPVAATLAGALAALLTQAFDATYPDHPRFEPADREVTRRELKNAFEHVSRAMAHPENRVRIDGDVYALARISNALGVGHATEADFYITDAQFSRWGATFEKGLGTRGTNAGPLTVAEVRGWLAEMTPPHGLKQEVSDLVILSWAALRQRAWFQGGVAIPSLAPGELRPEMELRQQPMPSAAEWQQANKVAGIVLGIHGGPYMTPAEVASFAEKVRDAIRMHRQSTEKLLEILSRSTSRMGLDADTSDRISTAREAVAMCERLAPLEGVGLIQTLAAVELGRPAAVGVSLASAAEVTRVLDSFEWERLDPLRQAADGEGNMADRASRIMRAVTDAMRADELVTPVKPALDRADRDAFSWVRDRAAEAEPARKRTEPSKETSTTRGPKRFRRLISRGRSTREIASELEWFRTEHPDGDLMVEWWLE